MTPEQAQRLEALPGWTWDPMADQWEQYFAALLVFVGREGHACVPDAAQVDGLRLGPWVRTQRAAHRRELLDPDRAARLEALPGWEWSPGRRPRRPQGEATP